MVLTRWNVIRSEKVASLGVATLRRDICLLSEKNEEYPYYILEMRPWVNVVALTENEDLLVVRQYRHGIGDFTTEIPAGGVEMGEQAQEAALRELTEETGYRAGSIVALGSWFCNPALQNNRLHTFLARSCIRVCEPTTLHGEQIHVDTIPASDWMTSDFAGRFDHYFSSHALRLAMDALISDR